ncbi:hypothetical protein ACOSQ4_004718 [Xanthoceras sorbifolium]
MGKFNETYMPNFKNRDSMTSLDIVLAGDIAAASTQEFSFTALLVKLNECAPRKTNGYDCGLFVCMFMRQSYLLTTDMKEFNSEVARLLLVSSLSNCLENESL